MEIYWHEQRAEDVPPGNAWLGVREAARLSALRVPKRIADWRLGRWTAKQALAQCLEIGDDPVALASIEILPAPSGAPVAYVAGAPAGWSISLAHREGRAVCALASGPVAFGCDLELVEARTDAFLADYFTAEEQRELACAPQADRELLATIFWSAKESALKALQEGLRLDTRSVCVKRVVPPGPWSLWSELTVEAQDGRKFEGWWRAEGNFVRTIISDPACNSPRRHGDTEARFPVFQPVQQGA